MFYLLSFLHQYLVTVTEDAEAVCSETLFIADEQPGILARLLRPVRHHFRHQRYI